MLAVDEVERGGQELLVHRFHSLAGQRAGVFDGLLAVGRRLALQHAARAELLLELGALGVVGVLRFLLGVEVVEVAEELVEPVDRRQHLVLVADVVLAELAGRVAEVLQELRDRGVLLLQAEVGARQADLGQPGADRRLAGEERGPAGGAALLPVPVGEPRPFSGDAVDVRASGSP